MFEQSFLGSFAFFPVRALQLTSRVLWTLTQGPGQAADERTRNAMLAGAHAAYELEENIMSEGVRARS